MKLADQVHRMVQVIGGIEVCLWAGLWSGVIVQLVCDTHKKWHKDACVMVDLLQLSYARRDARAFVLVFSLVYLLLIDFNQLLNRTN